MYRSLWFCVFLCFGVQANAQISDSLYKALPDSLRPKSKLAVTDKEGMRIILKNSPAFVYRFHNEIKTMDLHLEKAIETIKTNEDKMPYAEAIAGFYEQTGNIAQDVYWYKKIIAYGEDGKANRPILCNAYLNVAIAYAFQEKQDSAVYLLQKAKTIAIADKDSLTLRNTYYVNIPIYRKLQLYHQALDYATKYLNSLPAKEKWSTSYTEVTLVKANLFAWLYLTEKKPAYVDSAHVLIKKVMVATQKEEAYWYQICYSTLGLLHYYMDDYRVALQYYDLSLLPKYNQPGSYQANLIYKNKLHRNLCLLQMGKESNLTEVLAIKIPPRDFALKQELYKVLSTYYAQRSDYKKALDYYTQYKMYADSSDVIGQKGKVFEAEQKYSVAQKETDIAVLENKNLQEKNQKRGIAIVSLVVLIVLLLLYLYNRRQLTKRALEGQLLADKLQTMEKEMSLQQIKQRVDSENALVAQRKDISRNMHDEVSSSVATLRFLIKDRIGNAESKETKQVLTELEDETTEVYQQVRDFMHRLHVSDPAPGYDVVDFLHNLSLTFGPGSSLQVNTRYDADAIEQYFTPKHHIEAYLFIKEAVSNCMKHAGASKLSIEVYFQDADFCIDIRDNGKGMEKTFRGGIGIESMQERMKALGGDVTFWTDAGLHILGRFPVARQAVSA